MFMKTLAALAIGASLMSSASAGGLIDRAASAEQALVAGEASKTVAIMRSALIAAWQAAPISIDKAVFVEAAAAGFGIYNERSGNSFSPDQPLLIYLEPIGFVWAENDGIYRSHLIADFELLSPDGKILAGQENFGEFKFASLAHNTEYMVNLTLNISGAPVDQYVLKVTLRDQLNDDQSTSVRLPFEIK
ncbi:MAG: hypothetical protein ABJL55_13105 [Roseibium sp.]